MKKASLQTRDKRTPKDVCGEARLKRERKKERKKPFEHSFSPVCSIISVSLKILIRSNLVQVPQGPGVEINVILRCVTAKHAVACSCYTAMNRKCLIFVYFFQRCPVLKKVTALKSINFSQMQ